MFDSIVTALGKHWAAGSYMRLLGKRDLVDRLQRADCSNYLLIENRLGFTVLDFVLVAGKRVGLDR